MMSKVSSSENTTVAAAATEANDIIISQVSQYIYVY